VSFSLVDHAFSFCLIFNFIIWENPTSEVFFFFFRLDIYWETPLDFQHLF
jgi:hypothetical protein